MKKLLIATTNKAKFREMSALLADLSVELVSLSDVGIHTAVNEKGKTYVENSQLKALEYSRMSNLPAVADDGGFEIQALGGAPGINSHRWLGPKTTEAEIIEYMKKVAKELPDDNRHAAFTTVVSFALPDGKVWSVTGKIKGIIPPTPSLNLIDGFPYRSFFFLPKLNKYYFENELTPQEMNVYNHRVKAINRLKKLIQKELPLWYYEMYPNTNS